MKTPQRMREAHAQFLGFSSWEELTHKQGDGGHLDIVMERYAEEASTKKHPYSLRDHFAGLAMNLCNMGVTNEDETAKRAYALADAMLKARKTDTP